MILHLPDRGERGERGERGAIAIMTTFLAVALMAVAALGVDITSQVNQRQKLHDTVDAAALAGAYSLPNGAQAKVDALAFAAKNDPVAPTPVVDLFCVVASKGSGPWSVDTTQIPGACDPKVEKVNGYPNARCNASICSIPCDGQYDVCNVIRVGDAKPVPFSFAPVIGIKQGSTGSVSSAACKGPCGTTSPNPMDVAVVTDRTGSMQTADRNMMVAGVKSMFQVMTTSQQYVSLGTIGRSSPSSCKSSPSGSATSGSWIPVSFSNDYLIGGTTTVNTSSQLVQALNCLSSSSTGTSLASPMKAAARYLLGSPFDANNLGSLPARTGTARKAIIFETDGQPNESATTTGSTDLATGDVFSNTNDIWNVGLGTAKRYYYNGGAKACQNLKDVAANAKAKGILIVTIAYNLNGVDCDSNDTSYTGTRDCKSTAKACNYSKYATPAQVIDVLASSASPTPAGGASIADHNACVNQTARDLENADGDFFFCAASGTDMAEIFKTALGQILGGTRLIRLP